MSRQARYKIFDAALCSGATATVSTGIDISRASGNFSFSGALSSSVASASVTYEVSNDGTNYDVTTTDPTRTVISLLKGVELVKGFNLPLAQKVRIRCTGLTGNGTNNTVTGELSFTED